VGSPRDGLLAVVRDVPSGLDRGLDAADDDHRQDHQTGDRTTSGTAAVATTGDWGDEVMW